jgi:hypothetical protein
VNKLGSKLFQSRNEVIKVEMYRAIQAKTREFLGSTLPSKTGYVEGTRRIADGESTIGILTYGPYIALPMGQARCEVDYSAKGSSGRFDVSYWVGERQTIVNGGLLSDTGGVNRKVGLTFNLTEKVSLVECRTYFDSGNNLQISKISLGQDIEERTK